MRKEELLRQYYEAYKTNHINGEIVPGFGNAYSGIVLIGEAPGRDEVRQSRPFAGKAGRYLDEFLEHAGISRDEIYITNSIKYRLSKTDPRTGRVSNRPAQWSEVEENRPWLIDELDILRPKFVVTLGNVPLRAVTGERRISIGDAHGRAAEIIINEVRYTLYPLYHPASVIYNRSLKEVYIHDIKELKRLLKEDKNMTQLVIKPNVGIGEVKFGMSRCEVHEIMGMDKGLVVRGRLKGDTYYSSTFHILYDDNEKVEFIELANAITNECQVVFEGVEVFKTKAEELVPFTEKFSQYCKEHWEAQLGCMYIFKDIGLSFWRPSVFTEKTMQEPWFQKLSQEQKEDEMRHMYFESVSLAIKGYWDKILPSLLDI